MSKLKKIVLLFVFMFIVGTIVCGQEQAVTSPEYILEQMNNAFKSGTHVDYRIVSACIAALMENGSSTSYPALFSVLTAGYPEIIAYEAIGALDIVKGDLYSFLLGVIENNPPAEKIIAFKTGFYSQRLTVSERGQLTELALELSFTNTEDDADLIAMRYASISALAELSWKRASPLAIRHYYRAQADYLLRKIPKERYLEAIACLGAVGDSDAALVLVLQLGLINVRTERTGSFDSEITMAIVQALGSIGDSAAFDHLLYASNLSYDEEITTAAEEAIARLKW